MNSQPRSSKQPTRGQSQPPASLSIENAERSDVLGEREARRQLEATLKRAAKGDQDAWRVLVETYSGRVFGLIRAQSGSADLAEEITQSAFCTVVAKIDTYSELGKFEQWLFRIAMNRLRDEMRRRKRQARPTDDHALHAFVEAGAAGRSLHGAGTLESSVGADSEQLAALRRALAELPEADQQIIHLRHCAGLSFKDIAEILNQPLGTTLARQHRALKKLAEALEPVMDQHASVGRSRGGGPVTREGRSAGDRVRRSPADETEGLAPSGP